MHVISPALVWQLVSPNNSAINSLAVRVLVSTVNSLNQMTNSIAIATTTERNYLQAPEDGVYAGVPVPKRAVMFGVEEGRIYQFGETIKDKQFLDGGLPFYGLKGITRWSTESEKYGTLSYVRFFFTSPYRGVTYCLQLSDGTGRDGKATCPPAHIRGLVASLLKAKRQLEPVGQVLALMPGTLAPVGGDDPNVTFLNVFVGADPFDTNSMVQIFCEEDERLTKDAEDPFGELDAAIDELCEHLGQQTPESAAADAAAEELYNSAVEVQATDENSPF